LVRRKKMNKRNAKDEELLESVERGDWKSVPHVGRERRRFRKYADATFKKDRRINIRISSKDLHAIQTRALEEGIPYQTLISSLLHKYISGRLIEKGITRKA
jgi:predicted DNA binding CopG/RHH family protein